MKAALSCSQCLHVQSPSRWFLQNSPSQEEQSQGSTALHTNFGPALSSLAPPSSKSGTSVFILSQIPHYEGASLGVFPLEVQGFQSLSAQSLQIAQLLVQILNYGNKSSSQLLNIMLYRYMNQLIQLLQQACVTQPPLSPTFKRRELRLRGRN